MKTGLPNPPSQSSVYECPHICAELAIVFSKIKEAERFFKSHPELIRCEAGSVIVAEVDTSRFRSVDSTLEELFVLAKPYLPLLDQLVAENTCQILIDVWYWHNGLAPTIFLDGTNMELIRRLKANVYIQQYEGKYQ